MGEEVMKYFGFEYFCGANVLIRVGNMPLLEATGLSISLQESKRPIYGYSSRHFDAVASGQVLVQGQLIINYVHQDYLYHAIRAGLGIEDSTSKLPSIPEIEVEDYMSSLGNNPEVDGQFIATLKEQFWTSGPQSSTPPLLESARNPHDNFGGINLRVTFGDQDLSFKDSGKTGLLVSDVYFMGRSNVISISEDVVVEAYPFIARDIHTLRANRVSGYTAHDPTDPNFGDTVTIQ
jgi:hypothetical protein